MREPTIDDIDALVGPATPHFAFQLRARVSELRSEGHAVYANTRSSDGKTFYRLGTPSRTMVAAAYAAMGSAAFGQ